METPATGRRSLTRRGVLGTAAGTAAALALGTPAAATPETASPTVVTRNASLGVDLSRLLNGDSMADVRHIAGEMLADVDRARYEARAGAIAAEIEAAGADVVALQEAALLRTQRPSDFGEASAEDASAVVLDLLDLVQSALAARGLSYDVAAATVTTDVELPADADGEQVDVRITDRNALLVRDGVETREAVTDTFAAAPSVPLPGTDLTVSVRRGFCAADVVVDGVGFTAASTHLEAATSLVRRPQAEELLARLPDDRPVVLCGDFNSGPGTETGTYDLLTSTFEDAHATRRPDEDGFTCCQATTLTNDESRLSSRVDAILFRGSVRPTAVERVGHRPEDRIEVQSGDGTVEVWPSDHAGVVATFEVSAPAATPTPTESEEPATPTAAPTDEGGDTATPGGSGPGLGVVAAVAGLAGAVLARVRRK
ncbi:MAG: endonuclease/exonuclease/phosphatase family protein [Haloarculaceae archaeon]